MACKTLQFIKTCQFWSLTADTAWKRSSNTFRAYEGTVESAITRIHAIALIGDASCALRALLPNNIPILTARFVPATADDDISGAPVVAFAGIGQPEKFFETLAGMGCDLVDIAAFPDHHYFSKDEIMRLIDKAAAADAIVSQRRKTSSVYQKKQRA